MKVLFGDETYADKHVELDKNATKESDKLDKPLSNGAVIENNEDSEVKEMKNDEKEKKVTKGIWQSKRQSGKGKKGGNVKKQKPILSASAKKKIKKKEKLEKAKVCISLFSMWTLIVMWFVLINSNFFELYYHFSNIQIFGF